MMHKAWSNREEVPYCFWRSSVKFQGHKAKKIIAFDQIKRFPTVAPVWIHQWLRNDAKSLKEHKRGALLFLGVIHQISRSHRLKNRRFVSSLSKITRPVAAIKSLRFALFKVIHEISRSHVTKKSPILTWIEYFQIVTPFLTTTKQLYEWFSRSVCPSVCPSHLFDYVPIIVS